MSDAAKLVADLLVTAAVGTQGTDLFIGFQSDKVHACVAVYEGPGRDPNPKWALDFPAVQVIVRSAPGAYTTGRAKAQAVKDALLGISPDSTTRGIAMRGDINPLGQDESGRFEWSLNFQLTVEPATSGNRTAL